MTSLPAETDANSPVTPPPINRIGVFGLGIMGSAMAGHLLAAGFRVSGYDPDAARGAELSAAGGHLVASASALAGEIDVALLSLPSIRALQDTVRALSAPAGPRWIIETSTLPIADKLAARDALASFGRVLLDCPLSGTGAQARQRDLSVYASGDEFAYHQLALVFDAFSRSRHFLGEFGNGMKMKLVANLLVTIHNVAAAEAMVLGQKAGLDLATLYRVIGDGAGSSKMFQVRGPMMVQGNYLPATMKIDIYAKDLQLIGDFITDLGSVAPLFDASLPVYEQARAMGMGAYDTAAVCAVLQSHAATVRQR